MKNLTQQNRILAHLKHRGPITPLEALHLYGCFRLGARIYDLKAEGHRIKSKLVKVGEARVAQYSL